MCFVHRSSWRKNVFAKQKIKAGKIDCTNVWNVRCILNFVGTSIESSAIMILIALTLSDPAFSVVCQVRDRGGGGGSEAQMLKTKVNINMKPCMSHYTHKSIPDAKFEAGSSSSFVDTTSENFPRKKRTRQQIRLFTPGKPVLTLRE